MTFMINTVNLVNSRSSRLDVIFRSFSSLIYTELDINVFNPQKYTEFHCQGNFIFFYLNDSTIFMHYQIPRFKCACANTHLGLQQCISCVHVHWLVFFQNHAHIQNLRRSPLKCLNCYVTQ